MRQLTSSLAALLLLVLTGCESAAIPVEPGVAVPTPDVVSPLADLQAQLESAARTTPDELIGASALPFAADLGFDPLSAANLGLVQASSLALDVEESARLERDGFVVTAPPYPSMPYALETIYMEDLPVYVTADLILEAVHRGYDDLLKEVELTYLIPRLEALLARMRLALPGAPLTAAEMRDVDLYLGVAYALLSEAPVAPVGGADAGTVADLVSAAEAAQGLRRVQLFGADRAVDFSQFTVRGHYDDHPALGRYFRAMMWLGRIDFRMVETQPDGELLFHRRQLEGAVALRRTMDAEALGGWRAVDDAIRLFVGEPDGMTPPQIDDLLAAIDAGADEPLDRFGDEVLIGALLGSELGRQQILSHMMVREQGLEGPPLPMNRSLFFFPQRYVVDSHVLHQVVWDRVEAQRMMPDPLDVAYAALGNPQAVAHLGPELARYDYAGHLEAARRLVDAHGEPYWTANLYNRWVGSLRALSPSAAGFDDALPTTMRTAAWADRVMNTQLASWAELRHDTILYAKQSYTSGAACEFPDAYVEPYPAFWAALNGFAKEARTFVEGLRAEVTSTRTLDRAVDMLAELDDVTVRLGDMAERELRGEPFTEAQLAWINEAVSTEPLGCTPQDVGTGGWYGRLQIDPRRLAEYDPVVADVHTQPTDEGGAPVGRVLHVGVGRPRIMVVTVDTCHGPRAYAGPVLPFHQAITEDFERLTDDDWAARVSRGEVETPAWLADVF
jgi:hypothetical protein